MLGYSWCWCFFQAALNICATCSYDSLLPFVSYSFFSCFYTIPYFSLLSANKESKKLRNQKKKLPDADKFEDVSTGKYLLIPS